MFWDSFRQQGWAQRLRPTTLIFPKRRTNKEDRAQCPRQESNLDLPLRRTKGRVGGSPGIARHGNGFDRGLNVDIPGDMAQLGWV
jgi:hypothetical protein